ncbi:MOSC domain-containing protein [Spongisporangium articulatum]|uniref:MOSC domain-containing protein n=1 Tax=Spongisporangium articulatum TaxID=3362603 RepID=A0ABW8AS09_9ACTN
MVAQVLAVHSSPVHEFSKDPQAEIVLVEGWGVEGDTHAGITVQHRSRVARDPSQPNLRQVHLIHAELHDRLRATGHDVRPGQLGENVTTRGVDLLGLPTGTLLHLGETAVVEVTGLRNPCRQIEGFQAGLLAEVLHDEEGRVARTAGVMGVVRAGGHVRPGDPLTVVRPDAPHAPLAPV